MPAATSTGATTRLRWLLALLLFGLSLITFSRVLRAGFVPFDDDIEILNNPHIQHGISATALHWMFTDTRQTERYTPLSWLNWTILYSLFGPNPTAFHTEAWILHAFNTLLVFQLLEMLLTCGTSRAPPRMLLAFSAIGAALWALHPLRVEVVAWSTQVRFAEAAFFAVLTVLFYVRAVRACSNAAFRSPWFWVAALAFSVSLLFYPIGIGLIAVLPLLDVVPLRRYSPRSSPRFFFVRLALEKAAFLPAAVLVAVMTLYGRLHAGGLFQGPAAMKIFDLPHRIMQTAYVFLYYLWKPFLFWHVAPVYTTLVSFDPLSPPFILCLLAFVVISAISIWLWRPYPILAVIWWSHVALIAPVGGYFEYPHYPSDRYSYLQGVLWSAVAAALLLYGWRKMSPRLRPVLVVLGSTLAVAFAILSAGYTSIWQNGESLFLYIIADMGNDPYTIDIHSRLAELYLAQGDLAKSAREIDQALARGPRYPLALDAKGRLLLAAADKSRQQGDPASFYQPLYLEAARTFDMEASQNHQLRILVEAAQAYLAGGRPDIGAARAEIAVQAVPNDPGLHLLLAHEYAAAGNDTGAQREFGAAVKLDPSLAAQRSKRMQEWRHQQPTTAPAESRPQTDR